MLRRSLPMLSLLAAFPAGLANARTAPAPVNCQPLSPCPTDAVEVVTAVQDSTPAPSPLALEAFETAALGVDADGPYQGPDHRRLTWEDFYRVTGRPELIEAQSGRRYLRTGLGVVGGSALGVGVLLGLADATFTAAENVLSVPGCFVDSVGRSNQPGYNGGYGQPEPESCRQHEPSAAPWVVAAAGAGMLIAIPLIPRQPISAEAAGELASAHNRKLRQRYGLSVEASPLVAPGAGGVLVHGNF